MIGPFDSLRDYIAALDSKGLLVRIPKMDQDKYEATGFAYQLVSEEVLQRMLLARVHRRVL